MNRTLVLDDLYVGPGSQILAYLEPKVYQASVTVINHPQASASRVSEWTPRWQLVRQATKHWMLVDKPPGLASVATRDFARGTLVPYWLRKYLPRTLGNGGILTTSRLDVGTHGLIVVGRTSRYVGKHNGLIENRNVRKLYTCVVTGWNRPHIRRPFRYVKPRYVLLQEATGESQKQEKPQWVTTEEYEALAAHDPLPAPWRHTGLWEHYIPIRGLGEKEQESPQYGEILKSSARVGDWEHLRVPSSRHSSPGFEVPVKLIIEQVRPVTADSVALRPFPRRWSERLIEQAALYNEPLFELDIELLTGKTHQIRTQLECEGLVIIGDWLYGSPYLPDPNSFALCCRKLEWESPLENVTISYDLRNSHLTSTPTL